MRFSENWLREWVNPDVNTAELADQLSMAGLEVDGVAPAAAEFTGVVVGKVVSREAHPDADKLSVCLVDVNAQEQLQIVCGAKNVAAGMNVPVAVVGAKLPGDFKIKKAKLRGVQSMGMICSASELGLAESSDGILPLPADAPVGTDFRTYLDLDDTCIEVDLTPDRGDCLSIAGIARDVGVINQCPVQAPAFNVVDASINDQFVVKVEAPDACPRYCCRIIKGVDPQAETPQWMLEKLRRSDIRGINPVVDVTNYVLLELGQPMHGFDLSKLDSEIQVRMAKTGEKLTLLDGNEISLAEDSLVIADASQPLALAGIMGGETSGVVDGTEDILLEAAFFAPLAIAGKARSYGLHTDSSHRFERGVDSRLQIQAMERATGLLLDIVGGKAGPVVEVCSEDDLPASTPIRLRKQRISKLLGVVVSDEQVEDILARLGMLIVPSEDGWDVVPPSARFDIAIEADLIEEVGRIYGYANIPENLSAAPVSINTVKEASFRLINAKQRLVDRDYQEVITYSFISPEMADSIRPGEETIVLANPISTEMSVMRDNLWPGLIKTLQDNVARQQDRVRIFESGLSFVKNQDEIVQNPKLAGLIYGTKTTEQWASEEIKVDFYDLKADVEAVLDLVDLPGKFRFVALTDDPALHPGQAASIERNGQTIGKLGMMHPALQKKMGLNANVFLFELDIQALEQTKLPAFESLSKYPARRRDLAVVVNKAVNYSDVLVCAKKAASEIVRDVSVFDVYTGDNIDSDTKSLALRLILQDYSHTLSDEEVDSASGDILQALEQTLAAKLRD